MGLFSTIKNDRNNKPFPWWYFSYGLIASLISLQVIFNIVNKTVSWSKGPAMLVSACAIAIIPWALIGLVSKQWVIEKKKDWIILILVIVGLIAILWYLPQQFPGLFSSTNIYSMSEIFG